MYITEAVLITFRNRKYLIGFFVLWALIFVGMFSIPLNAIPGNDIRFQMSIFNPRDYILLGILSMLSSLIIIIQVNIFRSGYNSSGNAGNAAIGGVGVLSGIFSSLFASATCAMCLGAIFSFLGFGTVFFLVDNRWYILIGASLLLGISLYFASRRLVEGCKMCLIRQ